MSKKTVLIVGGGTAGLVIANNLQNKFDVIVVEKSEYNNYPARYGIPLVIGLLFRSNILKYILKREVVLEDGRHIPFFESNVLGGASPINGCVHTIGSKLIWERILEKFNSSYDELLNSYETLYTKSQTKINKINLMLAPQNSVDHIFARALNGKGVPSGDMNFSNEENCGPIYNTTRKIFRTSVLSLMKELSCKIFLKENVEHILVESSGKVAGVETDKRAIKADYVILSAGVIGTCALLLREKNRENPSSYLANLAVGSEVQDHTNLRVNVITKREIGSLNEISQSIFKKASMFLKHCLGVPTLMAGTGATSGAHLDLDKDGEVDTRIHVCQFIETGRHGSDGKYFSDEPGFSLSITPINPASKGRITVQGEDVRIDPQYLSNKKDIEILTLALRYCLELLRSEHFNHLVKEILNEQQIVENPGKYINDNFFSGHHLIGGCQTAVDAEFKVKGVDGLYISDASIFGEYAASNIHSSVVLISDIFTKSFLSNNFVN